MSIQYGSLYVDEKYSPMLEPVLFYNSIFVPGQTYTDKYEVGPGGAIYVSQLTSSETTPGLPGRDFTDSAVASSQIQITLNNNYQQSKKIYGVQKDNVSYDLADNTLSNAIASVREGWNKGGLASLYTEGTSLTSTTALTVSNIKNSILSARTACSTAKTTPNVLLCSPATYSLILEAAGTQFTPNVNDAITLSGQVGSWLGLTVIEANLLASSTAFIYNKYDYSSAATTVTAANMNKVDYIMYDYNALSIVNNFELARIIDSENFSGSKAQVEMNSGFRVTNATAVQIKKHA